MSVRIKRKPPTYEMKFVRGLSRSGRVQIEKVSVPLIPEVNQREQNASGSRMIDEHQEELQINDATNADHDITVQDLPSFDDYDARSNSKNSIANESAYYKRQRKATEAWAEIREQLLCSTVASIPLCNGAICILCKTQQAVVLCRQCGSQGCYCEQCALDIHAECNLFHTPFIQKDNRHLPLRLPPAAIKLPIHTCSSRFHTLTCVGLSGVQRDICFESCECIDELQAIIRAGFFPASPKRPQLAFDIQLLDLLEALLLECQVAVKDFISAIKYLHNGLIVEEKDLKVLYPVIIDCFEEYRFLKSQLDELQFICPNLYNRTKCPACPQDGGKLYLSMDGLFGLCRKIAAGKSVRPPLHDGKYFEVQGNVDQFVNEYAVKPNQRPVEECNEFLAGSVLRSKSRYSALDETGVIGIACRHEYPYCFYSLRHGERISYIVYALEKLKEQCSNQSAVYLLYDVACILKRHLRSQQRDDLTEFFKLAVPVFHAYGHKLDCQFSMSAAYQMGYGLTDGEVLERLWSFLRRFSKMTKEMRPSHRVDVLTDALLYYAKLAANNLQYLLPMRYERAKEVAIKSQKELEELRSSTLVPFSDDDIKVWLEIERRSARKPQSNNQDEWKFQYISVLELHQTVSNQILAANQDPDNYCSLMSQLKRVERKMVAIEQQHGISHRWTKSSLQYQEAEKIRSEKEIQSTFTQIEVCARERWFLLIVKAKFADGQYMASRISRAIQRETSKLKKLLACYNQLVPTNQQLSWNQLTDLSSSVWTGQDQSEICVPRSVRLSAIKAHQKMHRAQEEVEILKSEMCSTITFYVKQFNTLKESFDKLVNSSAPLPSFDLGCLYLCGAKLSEFKRCIFVHCRSFEQYISLPTISPDILAEYDSCHIPSPIHSPTVELPGVNIYPHVDQLPQESSDVTFVEQPSGGSHCNLPKSRSSVSRSSDNVGLPLRVLEQQHCHEQPRVHSNALLSLSHSPTVELTDTDVFPHADQTPQEPSEVEGEGPYHEVLEESQQPHAHNTDMLSFSKHHRFLAANCTPYEDHTEGTASSSYDAFVDEDDELQASGYGSDASSSDDDSSSADIDFEEAARYARMIKDQLEMDDFLRDHEQPTNLMDLLPKVTVTSRHFQERKGTGDTHFTGHKRKTLYLHRSEEQLQQLSKSTKEDLKKARIAEKLAKMHYFNVAPKQKH